MKRLVTLALFVALSAALSAPGAQAQSAAFSDVTGVEAGPVEAARGGEEVLLENFDKGQQQALTYSYNDGASYAFGTNVNQLRYASGYRYEEDPVPATYTVTGADLYFTAVDDMPASPTYTVGVYSGDLTSGPAQELYTQEYNWSDVQLNPGGLVATTVTFDTPVEIPGDDVFFLYLDFGDGGVGSGGSIAATEDLNVVQDRAWILFNGSWVLTDGVFQDLQVFYWVDARIMLPTTANEGTALPGVSTISTVYPNPFRSSASLTLDFVQATDMEITLHDVLGREVAVLSSGVLPAGSTKLDITAQNLPSGLYFVRAESGGQTVTRKVALVR